MYAVIKTGGKQYKVAAGQKIKVEQIAADVGQEVVIDQVLAVGSGADLKVGAPWVAGATVTATVLAQGITKSTAVIARLTPNCLSPTSTTARAAQRKQPWLHLHNGHRKRVVVMTSS
jgi:ribosomal protein L21